MKHFILTLLFCIGLLPGLHAANQRTHVVLHTNEGDITVELYNETPRHRDNFIRLCESHFYDSLLFHRVIRDFMIQAGDPDSRGADLNVDLGEGGPGYDLPAEIRFPQFFHRRGALAAAREGDRTNPERRSSGSQFYIVWGKRFSKSELDDVARAVKERTGESPNWPDSIRQVYRKQGGAPHLDGQYTVFGQVINGMEVVDRIQKQVTTDGDRPRRDILILSTEVIRPQQ